MYRTVPTKDQLYGKEAVPESLLKKRKTQEKEREARASELAKKRKVSDIFYNSA